MFHSIYKILIIISWVCPGKSEVLKYYSSGYIRTNEDRLIWFNLNYPCIILVCFFFFSFISKTETLNMDLQYIIAKKLSGKRKVKYINSSRGQNNYASQERYLPLFSQLPNPESWIQKLMVQYEEDMDVFGYSYAIRDGRVYASCSTYMFGGLCV